jgi:hypothetical protein
MKIPSKILNMRFIALFLLFIFIPMGRTQQREREWERELYQKDFFLNLRTYEAAEAEDEDEKPHKITDDDDDDDKTEEDLKDGDEYDDDDDEEDVNQIIMSDDYFVLPPEGRQREDVLFFFLLPGLFGILTLALGWGYLRVWLHDKKELHQTRLSLFKLRSEFRGKPTDPEFRSQLKKTLRLPPGASSADIKRKMPLQDRELQNMINKYDEKFRKSDS